MVNGQQPGQDATGGRNGAAGRHGTGGGGTAGSPPANPELERALLGAARGAGRTGVYAAFVNGPVLVPTVRRTERGPGTPALLRLPGRPDEILLGFSSHQALRKWSSQFATFTVMPGSDLARVARASRAAGVVLDAGGATELALAPAELDELADGRVPSPSGSGAPSVSYAPRRIRPTQARWPPEALAVIRRVAGRPEVEASYVFDVSYTGGEPVPAVGLRFATQDAGAVQQVMSELAGQLGKVLPQGDAADLIVVDDELLPALRDRVSPLTGPGAADGQR